MKTITVKLSFTDILALDQIIEREMLRECAFESNPYSPYGRKLISLNKRFDKYYSEMKEETVK